MADPQLTPEQRAYYNGLRREKKSPSLEVRQAAELLIAHFLGCLEKDVRLRLLGVTNRSVVAPSAIARQERENQCSAELADLRKNLDAARKNGRAAWEEVDGMVSGFLRKFSDLQEKLPSGAAIQFYMSADHSWAVCIQVEDRPFKYSIQVQPPKE